VIQPPSSITVSGDGHITAGGSITIVSDTNALERLKAKLIELDIYFRKKLGEIVSSRTNLTVPFSCEKIISSLVALDIPPHAAYMVTFELQKYLIPAANDKVTTNAIRMAVAKALFNIDFGAELNARREEWAKRYARRYGNPDQLIFVIHQDGEQEPLDYKYVKQQLIPHLLRRVWAVRDATPFLGWIVSQQTISDMAQGILDEVKRLDLYSIRYKTLLYVAEDLALQPPHPWLVSPFSQERTIAYDFERIRTHLARLTVSDKQDEGMWQAVGECVHHSCSAILALYGYLLGPRYLSPLNNLRNVLVMNFENASLWSFCNIRNIESDLLLAQSSVASVIQLLKKIEKLLSHRTSENLEAITRLTVELADIAIRIRTEIDARQKILNQLLENKVIGDEEFLAIAKQLLIGVNSIKEHKPLRRDAIMLHQRSQATLFQRTQPLIVLTGSSSANLQTAVLAIDVAIDLMRAHDQACNTIFFFHSDELGDATKNYLREKIGRNESCILISRSSLTRLARATDKAAAFEEIFLTNVA
jgi:hypothetical protein